MISEALLEFEESLAEMSGSSHSTMLEHLDLMADLNRFSVAAGPECSTDKTQISQLFGAYNYAADEVTLCPTCQGRISARALPCCASFIATASQFTSGLESDFWHSFIENTYKTLLTLPHYTRVAFFQVGVPFQLRPLVWQKLVLVNQKNQGGVPDEARVLFKNFQHSYNREISKQIKKDLTRTFPHVAFFSDRATVDSLLTILNVYANYDLDLGYCQGLLFLVGTLFYHLRDQEATFHALCKIMECEPELRSIFVPATMSSTLERWYAEFYAILTAVDPQLASHLAAFCDCKVFLYQWWLSGTLIHAPDFTVNNRIVDFCLVEGWKVGIFKISAALLRCNRPILMSFGDGDEEVVYQHLLNESKWGHVINNSTTFFGDTLLSMDERLFAGGPADALAPMATTPPKKKRAHARTGSSVLGMLKSLTVSPGGPAPKDAGMHSATSLVSADSFATNDSRSSLFLPSPARDTESIYSNATSLSWDRPAKYRPRKGSYSDSGSIRTSLDDLAAENDALKALLRKAYVTLEDESLKRDICSAIEV